MIKQTSRDYYIGYIVKNIAGLKRSNIATIPLEDAYYISLIVSSLKKLDVSMTWVNGSKQDVVPFVLDENTTTLNIPSKEKLTAVNLSLCAGELICYVQGSRNIDILLQKIEYFKDVMSEDELLDILYDEIVFSALLFLYTIPGLENIAAMVGSFSERAFNSIQMLIDSPYVSKKIKKDMTRDDFLSLFREEVSIFQHLTDRILYSSRNMYFDYATLNSERLIGGNC